MYGQTRCPCCGYGMSVPSTPYSDSSVELIDSLTREVNYLRSVVARMWKSDWSTGTLPEQVTASSSL
ncbi:hypothetical protein PA7_43010 [Pseudonocardia asaccharolytica DSM 44247 = NBRC 16224]|uniref:Uncharacterized protein n=2 Tax=Pseudonocardia asaccharolytica TaxID=54010 RepID=A0A511D9Z7_9PSEU|nr:hypothetical protein PA7_43010 [Pseudonocardia asaccharolytica DSM 44247 = NBRC 16224]